MALASVEYYKRLERGNATGASESVLDAVADALQLDDAERPPAMKPTARDRPATRERLAFLLCYVRGPEGLIVELAERLDGAPG